VDEPKSPWPGDAGDVLLRALLRLAREREDVRVALTTVQGWLARELGDLVEGAPAPASGDSPSGADRPPTADTGVRLPLRVITPHTQARTGGTHDAPDHRGLGPREESKRPARRVELPLVVRRARWKAAACRMALDLSEVAGAGPEREDLLRLEADLRRRREGLEECPTWMLDPSRDGAGRGSLNDAAACYETLALVAEGLVELENAGKLTPTPPAELLQLLAETQSALLAAVHACDQRGDSDQRDLFLWLKDQTIRHRIYVDRHMRLDDPADPARSQERAQRFRELSDRLLRGHNRRQFRGQLLNKIRFHVGKVREAEEAGDHADNGDHDWESVGLAADEWLRLGLPAEDADLLALLRPLAEEFAATRTLPGPLTRLLHKGKAPAPAPQLADSRASHDDAAGNLRPAPLERVAELLEGKRAVIFVRGEDIVMREPLSAALHLTQIRWVELPIEDPLETVEREIGAEDVDLVLIAERLPEQEYAEFKRLCLESGRPFVRLPAGLAPDQVAHQVLRQVGWRLRDRDAVAPSG